MFGPARGYGLNGMHYFTNVCKPMDVNLNFIVDSSNGNGLGIRSLKSNGFVANVFMHTSAPLAGSGNPNPAAGFAMVKFQNNFNYYLGGYDGFIAPLSGAPLGSTTAGTAYTIVSLGTTTLAQWQASGVPMGFTPAVGMSYVATATGAIGGTGAVETSTNSPIVATSVIGDPNKTLNNSNITANGGAYIIVDFLAATAGGNTALIPTAPANGTVIGMMFRFDGSSVTVDGI